MRWIGNKYVDEDGRIVAGIADIGSCDDWAATGFDPGKHEPLGRFLTEPDAKRAVERWWAERSRPTVIDLRERA
jgi:hypothetical protein